MSARAIEVPPESRSQRLPDLRLVISGTALLCLAVYFWSSSRYPALNDKALMGTDTHLMGLAFDIVLDVLPGSSLWWEIVANTVNWVSTNIKGMTFGVLFGAGILTMLSVVRRRAFGNGFANSALGAVIGAPLGVCVNCAAPIAFGLHLGRMRLETTLSALVASPTLNVIVVTMSFAMLPAHVAGIKLGLALIMVLLVVPLLCRYVLRDESLSSRSNSAAPEPVGRARGLTGWIARALAPRSSGEASPGLLPSLTWFVRTYSRNFFFVALITVPMMFLAALLGALVAALFHSQTLVEVLPAGNAILVLLAMFAVALVASIAPAPMALDVILTAVLMGIGLSSDYATVILIALGSFSVYAFMILWRAISLRTALAMWAATLALAVAGGVLAKFTARYEAAFMEQRTLDHLRTAPFVRDVPVPPPPIGRTIESLRPEFARQTVRMAGIPAAIASDRGSEVTLFAAEGYGAHVATGAGDPAPGFARIPGQTLGLDERATPLAIWKFAPDAMHGGIAAGDINGDRWIDLIIPRPVGATGLSIYVNLGGRFQRQEVDLGAVAGADVVNVGLADLDSDSRLDLVVSTQTDGIFVFPNQGGYFDRLHSTRLPSSPNTLAMSIGFADFDRDGLLDIAMGNWTTNTGLEGWDRVQPVDNRNQVAWNLGGGRFDVRDIDGSAGQTLSTLIHDFNGDGIPDLLKGDDVAATDQVIFFAGGRRTLVPQRRTQPFPYLMTSSMSYDVGDWNNDLVRDYYGGQIADRRRGSRHASKGDGTLMEICLQMGRDEAGPTSAVRACASRLKSTDQIRGNRINDRCGSAQWQIDVTHCFILQYLLDLRRKVYRSGAMTPEAAAAECRSLLARWSFTEPYCASFLLETRPRLNSAALSRGHVPAVDNRNILMTGNTDGTFRDDAAGQGVKDPGWTWNARFVDLDQDGWQDLLVMTGSWMAASKSTTNVFYRNDRGRFLDATEPFGFHDQIPSHSYASFDYDRDGDIDTITGAGSSRSIVYRNDRPAGPALWVELRDRNANSMGVGAEVTVCVDGETRVRPGRCQVRDIKASGGYMSMDPVAAHFGLGDARSVSLIQVKWPDGEVTRIRPARLLGGEIQIARQ